MTQHRNVETSLLILVMRPLCLVHEPESRRRMDRAADDAQLPEQRPEERRLPAAVRAEDADALPPGELERDALEHRRAAVASREVADVEELGHRHLTFPPLRPRAIASPFTSSI